MISILLPKYVKMMGFSLLEALIALVIMSLVFTSTWAWFGNVAQSTYRLEESIELPGMFEQYLDHMASEPLQEKSVGTVEINGYLFDWKVSVNRQSNQEIYRRQPTQRVTLFDLQVKIFNGERLSSELSTQIVRQWREP